MHIQLDTLGGIAGDMFLAAMLDARPDLVDGTLAAIDAAGLPASCRVSVGEHSDHAFRGKRFAVEPAGGLHGDHVRYARIVHDLLKAPLADGVRNRALGIFGLLAQAESDVHGISVDDVEFHEVGAWDSIADIVGAAAILDALDPGSWSIGPVPIGAGRVDTQHGPLPIPAPATARLLQGFTLIDDGIDGERVTPTGAAILRYLWTVLGAPLRASPGPLRLQHAGTGFGTKILPGISNVLRVLLFEEAAGGRSDDRVGVITFEIDDQTAEDLAIGIEALRAHAAVLDVLQMPAFGKKGRMVFHVQVLCRPEALDEVIEACFTQTTTIGLRWNISARAKLPRESASAGLDVDPVGVKLAKRPDGTTSAKAEADDLARFGGRRDRQRKRTAAESRALGERARPESCRGK